MIKPLAVTTGKSLSEESADFGPGKINIVLNWIEELKERMPVQ
jgi:hypothetical protein